MLHILDTFTYGTIDSETVWRQASLSTRLLRVGGRRETLRGLLASQAWPLKTWDSLIESEVKQSRVSPLIENALSQDLGLSSLKKLLRLRGFRGTFWGHLASQA